MDDVAKQAMIPTDLVPSHLQLLRKLMILLLQSSCGLAVPFLERRDLLAVLDPHLPHSPLVISCQVHHALLMSDPLLLQSGLNMQ